MLDILLLGPYGSGKTTQAEALARTLGYAHFDAGHALRTFAAADTPEAAELRAVMGRGDLVTPRLPLDLYREAVELNPHLAFVIDGLARDEAQLRLFVPLLAELGRDVLPIFIDVPLEESVRRQVERRVCTACGAGWKKEDTSCPSCGGEAFATRVENDPAIARHRAELYATNVAPILAHYRAHGLVEIDGKQRVEAVSRDILAAVTRARLLHHG